MVRNAVQLITYADRLAGDLPGLRRLLASEPWASAFGGVHVLPPYTPYDGADAGFDPVDHTSIDPRLGTWADVRALAEGRDVVLDLIVNHVSADSAQFRDVVEHGAASPYADMFLTFATVFPDGADEAELARVYRPRPGLPFTRYLLGGVSRLVWTTFTAQQIDLDVRSAPARDYLASILAAVAAAGVQLVRLDAVGYSVKTAGTTCFMTPETFDFIAEFTAAARAQGVDVLVEVHSYVRRQVEVAASVDLVYDFALPPLLLHSLTTGDGRALAQWMAMRPSNAVTVLDTHDGIGVIDIGAEREGPGEGLLDDAALAALVAGIHERTGGASQQATGGSAVNLDLYQVNSTYYDALGADDALYLTARAIQLFTPGIPQVYYVGALAGHNDVDLLRATGVGREINRHRYTPAEVDEALARPVVAALFALCAFRSRFPAFDGDFTFEADEAARILRYSWHADDAGALLLVDLATGATHLSWDGAAGSGSTDDLLGDPPVTA